MIELIFLAVREGFFQDLLFPAIALIVIFALIAQQLLNKWGYTLW